MSHTLKCKLCDVGTLSGLLPVSPQYPEQCWARNDNPVSISHIVEFSPTLAQIEFGRCLRRLSPGLSTVLGPVLGRHTAPALMELII